ncbi:nitroreductase family deazaflavin-dependent oxidoreductase [Streptomyces yaizuensis]|uniref:Nitroreductase family deazaflavin-dependent oxidoreductase n=1 Tax=Streptomyces yaizuensis TaxID=2989713 RepID=A0ABQ5P488_9ACTN|nr:nitroreductase family deazaflavin-dependent oxidoreductase [Streptomyces sp. YSPA8]GLF97327.1 nitroreductase family deazaflavin-dependent oxidoreductase [Streptomyces sp. YSPA8]
MTTRRPPLTVRAARRISATRAFARLAPRVVPALDHWVHRLTRGRVLPSTRMLPGAVITARGARTGLPRAIPLACMPEQDGTWVLVGSNFGRPHHPAWTANLLAHPDAGMNWKGDDFPVTARLLEGAEREETWARVLDFWPPYAAYQARIDRRIRLFRLTRRPAPPP